MPPGQIQPIQVPKKGRKGINHFDTTCILQGSATWRILLLMSKFILTPEMSLTRYCVRGKFSLMTAKCSGLWMEEGSEGGRGREGGGGREGEGSEGGRGK